MNILALTKIIGQVRELPAGAIAPAGFQKEQDGCLLLTLRLGPPALKVALEVTEALGLDLAEADQAALRALLSAPSTPADAPQEARTASPESGPDK